jgi:lipopolysaccharide export system protein LptA
MTRIGRAFAAALLLAAGTASAQELDLSSGGAIDITSRDGMEWRQNEQMVVARGDARAVRANVTVTADVLIARYRRKAGVTQAAAGTPAPKPGPLGAAGSDTGSNEIYRLEAEGHVKIFTATDLAICDKAVYDIDQAVLLMTGANMSITTPTQVMTARDAMEYWSQKHMGVGRGLATVTTNDGRRVAGDVLVGFTVPPTPAPGQPAARSAVMPPAAGKPSADPLGTSGKLQRVEGFGNVQVRTATEIVNGDRGVYVADSGIARLAGNVRITRGQNQLEGDEALVNMRTGISTLVREPGKRVEGLVIPNDATNKTDSKPAAAKGPAPSTPVRTR